MTYNFDPERWYDNEIAALDMKKSRGDLTNDEYRVALDELAEDYEKMLDRLDIRYDYAP